MRKLVRAAALAAVFVTGVASLAAPSFAASGKGAAPRIWRVAQGESIQDAVDAARPGDTILLRPGVYRQSVLIRKNGITLAGSGDGANGSIVRAPGTLPKGMCTKFTGGSGVCVLAKDFDPATGAITTRVSNVTVRGIRFEDWPSMGIFAYGARNVGMVGNTSIDAEEYGFARFDSTGGVIANNSATGSEEAGIYVGDSLNANAQITHNDVYGNGFGIFIRHAHNVFVRLNDGWDNCQGILALDDGQPEGLGGLQIRYNVMRTNNLKCPPSDEAPPLKGGGIALIGATDSEVSWNTVRGNHGQKILSGGIVLISATGITGGVDPSNNLIEDNTLRDNSPADIIWDGTGSGNTFSANNCDTSVPGGLC